MKSKIWIAVITFIAVLSGNNYPVSAQNANNKNNGTVEMIALYVPDFIVFKPAKGKEFEKWEIWLVSKGTGKSFKAFKTSALRVTIKNNNGEWESTCTDKSEVRAMFNIDDNFFEASKIKFVIDGKEMYYNIANDEWE